MVTQENVLWLIKKLLRLQFFIFISFGAAFIGRIATQSSVNDWFRTLTEPPYDPPGWIIPIVWLVLYLMIAIAGFLVWEQNEAHDILPAMSIFAVQILLNALWPVLFFGLHELGWAFVEICLLWTSAASFIVLSWSISRVAAYLFVPYGIWLAYAGYLNFMYWYLN